MSTVARLACDEETARRVASILAESLDPEEAACAAFEDECGQWHVSVHFAHRPDEQRVRALVEIAAGERAARALAFEIVADVDWVRRSLEGLTPVRANRFVVHGAHDRARLPLNAVGIEIEAALAFGTGHHGTTRGCLLVLDTLVKRQGRIPSSCRARGKPKILDIGTGSGVLAIAAAKSLRAPVLASDIDRVAVNAARANARLNGTASYIRFVHAAGANARPIRQHGPYDLIFANILLGPLMRLAWPIRRLAAPGAQVVLSGLLPAHAADALAAYRAQGFVLKRRLTLDGWMTLLLQRAARPSREPTRSG